MSIKEIACCTDFSINADAAFSMALDMAEKYEAFLSVIHVMPPEVSPLSAGDGAAGAPPKSLVLEIEEKMEQAYMKRIGAHVESECIVLAGHVSTELLKYLDENKPDLAIMGSYGLTGMGLVVFGSVAKRVAHKSPCSVMIVRPEEQPAAAATESPRA